VHDNDSSDDITVTGRLSANGDVDYYYVLAVDDNPTLPQENFHVDIQFTDNPNAEFAFDVWRRTGNPCTGTGSILCSDATGVDGDIFEWFVDFQGDCDDASPQPCSWGELNCINAPRTGDAPACSDNTAYFVVAVKRASTAIPSCASYTLQIRNE